MEIIDKIMSELKHQGKSQVDLAAHLCTGLVCWVEYYIVKNLVLLSAAYLTGGNL